MKHLYKRLLALMLTGVLALSSLPATAWAEGDSLPEAPVAQTEICPDCGAAADIPGGVIAHTAECIQYEGDPQPGETLPVCDCGAAEGEAHAEGCPLYQQPESQPGEILPVCDCGAAEGEAHAESCPLYQQTEPQPEEILPACDCGAAEGEIHAESCPLYDPADQPATLELPPEGTVVAEVDGTGYTDLQEAIDAADGKTVKLVSDVDISAVGLIVSKSVTLDLNGCEIKAANTSAGNINVSGHLTLCDNGDGTGVITTETDYKDSNTGHAIIDVAGSFVMESGTINAVRPDASKKASLV